MRDDGGIFYNVSGFRALRCRRRFLMDQGDPVALIREFQPVVAEKCGLHKPVSCGWRKFQAGDETILQLDTYGSSERQIPNKVSQSIQLDREGAAQLAGLIRDTFPGL